MEKLLGIAIPYITNAVDLSEITEIRIRLGKKISVKTLSYSVLIPFIADENYIYSVIEVATGGSRYAHEDSIADGFIDYKNGIRVGLIGDGWVKNGKVIYKNFYSLCIRIARQIHFYSEIPSFIFKNIENTLLISPPGGGKTTLLREFALRLSNTHDLLVIDERSEICGKSLVMAMGDKCDILQGIPKKYAFETAIRTMAPEIVVCDELFGNDDYYAVKVLASSGIKVIATFHSDRYIPKVLDKLFENKIYLSSKPCPGSIKSIVHHHTLIYGEKCH